MKLSDVKSKARRNTLEVEHILKAARLRIPGLQAELERLSAELDWSLEAYPGDGTHVVPFAKWARVAGAYAEEGFQGVHRFARSDSSFVIALLEELRSAEALQTALEFYRDVVGNPSDDLEIAGQLATLFNLLLNNKGAVEATESQASAVRAFLIAFMQVADKPANIATAVYGLRGVGDEAAVSVLAQLPALPSPWEDAVNVTTRAIRKRLKSLSCQVKR